MKDDEKKGKTLEEEELKKVSGGTEPKEFDYTPKGYVTPVKEEDDDPTRWHFGPIGNHENE